MIMARLVVALALMGALTSPAVADWQNTRWGMMPEEAETLPGIRPATPEMGFDSETQQALFVMDYEAAGIPATAGLIFGRSDKSAGLKEIHLRIKNAEDCSAALGRLRQTYGEEHSSSDGEYTAYRIWSVAEHGNRILYMTIGEDYCSVTYQPILKGNTAGNF